MHKIVLIIALLDIILKLFFFNIIVYYLNL